MSTNVSWVFELTLHEGQLDNLKALMHEMVESTGAEPGTLAYEWSLSADGTVCHIHERYADSAATVQHLHGFLEKFADRLMATGEATSFVVYGTPDDAARAILDGFSPTYMAPLGGFAR